MSETKTHPADELREAALAQYRKMTSAEYPGNWSDGKERLAAAAQLALVCEMDRLTTILDGLREDVESLQATVERIADKG
jgi:hypothetical protein